MNERMRVVRITTWIAGAVALGVAVIIPLAYFVVSFERIKGNLESETEINSRLISGIINANPDLWRYEHLRLGELLARRPQEEVKENRRILDLEGKVVVESAGPLAPPLVKGTHDLKDAGVTVGRIEISRSLFPVLVLTGLMALIGFAMGLTVFITLRVLPIRAVVRAEEQLRRLNEELELKVAERTKQLVAAQEELVQKEKLAMLGLIAGGMGNELRNPLGVMNNAVFFLKSVMPEADETIREYLDIIMQEIGNAQGIITDLLDFYHIKAPQTKPVLVRELIDQSLVKCSIPGNVRILFDMPETLPPVKVDPVQMGRVMRNLITNAVQAMPDGGTVRISARPAIDAEEARRVAEGGRQKDQGSASRLSEYNASIKISISDDGEGIAPEHMDKIFQPLFSTRSRGLGLGLAFSLKLTEVNGGRIEAESRAGEGATFSLFLTAEKS